MPSYHLLCDARLPGGLHRGHGWRGKTACHPDPNGYACVSWRDGKCGLCQPESPGSSANWGQTVYAENGAMFSAGQVVLISNGFQVSLGQITQVHNDGELEFRNGQDLLQLNPGSTAQVPNPNMSAAQQITGGPPPQLYPLSSITYFIDSTTDPANPSIKRLANSNAGAAGATKVADDIENLTVVFLVDADSNMTTPAVEIANPSTDQLSLVRGIKVTITDALT